MSMSLEAKAGEIADAVVLTSDPAKVKEIAESLLKNAVCYSRVRNMLGYTGEYKGRRVSVQGIGIGVASAAIYCSELAESYGVKTMVRIEAAAGIHPLAGLSHLVLAQAAHTTSSMNRLLFDGRTFAGTADWELLNAAHDSAIAQGIAVNVGGVLTLEAAADDAMVPAFASRGALCAEFETSALYLCAGRFGVKALSMMTIFENTLEKTRVPEDRQKQDFNCMARLALALCAEREGTK